MIISVFWWNFSTRLPSALADIAWPKRARPRDGWESGILKNQSIGALQLMPYPLRNSSWRKWIHILCYSGACCDQRLLIVFRIFLSDRMIVSAIENIYTAARRQGHSLRPLKQHFSRQKQLIRKRRKENRRWWRRQRRQRWKCWLLGGVIRLVFRWDGTFLYSSWQTSWLRSFALTRKLFSFTPRSFSFSPRGSFPRVIEWSRLRDNSSIIFRWRPRHYRYGRSYRRQNSLLWCCTLRGTRFGNLLATFVDRRVGPLMVFNRPLSPPVPTGRFQFI